MSEQGEPKLTDEQRDDWEVEVGRQVAWLDENADSPDMTRHAELISAVNDRLAWLEVERDHLDARADHATTELLALGRELKQAREERDALRSALESARLDNTAMLRQRDEAQADVWDWRNRLAERCNEGDRAVAEAAVLRMRLDKMYPPTFRDDDGVLRERASPLDRLVPLATHAAEVLATCVAEGEAFDEMVRATDKVQHRAAVVKEGAAQSARRRAVDAYRATLHDTT